MHVYHRRRWLLHEYRLHIYINSYARYTNTTKSRPVNRFNVISSQLSEETDCQEYNKPSGCLRLQCGAMIPAAASKHKTSSLRASRPSSSQRQYSTARNRTPLLPLVCPLQLVPLPLGLPLDGRSMDCAPAGAMSDISWAYPSRIAFRRLCSDMI